MHEMIPFRFVLLMLLHLGLVLTQRAALCRSYVIQSGKWMFRGHPIAYEVAQSIPDNNADDDDITRVDVPPLLLLNGFGVGSFHQHRLIHELLGGGSSSQCYPGKQKQEEGQDPLLLLIY